MVGLGYTTPADLGSGRSNKESGVGFDPNAFFTVLERATRTYERPEFALHPVSIQGHEYDPEIEVIQDRPFCRLIHFRKSGAPKQPKLLIVAPLSGHFASLLRDTIQTSLQDCDVYLTEWKNARDVPLESGGFDLDDYIDYIIDDFKIIGGDLHVLSVCQPVVPVMAAIALLAAENAPFQPRSAIMMGGPIDTRVGSSVVARFAESNSLEWFQNNMISVVPAPYSGKGRKVCPGFVILTSFVSMNVKRHWQAHLKYLKDLFEGERVHARIHEKFYDEYQSVMDLPAEYFLQTLKTVFQEHHLPRGCMNSRGRKVDLAAITSTALMTVEGELDDISPPGETQALHGLCPNVPQDRRDHYLQPGVGHYGVFSGHLWREQIFPRILSFIQKTEGLA